MEQGQEQETGAPLSMAELLERAGIRVTPEGRERARRRLAESRRRHAENAGESAAFVAGLRSGAA